MKRWAPIAYPGPGDKHRNADPAAGIRGSWPDAAGYQQNVIDEPSNAVEKSGFTLDGSNPFQLATAIRSQAMNYRTAGGTTNALTVTLDPAPAAYTLGLPLRVKPAVANTGAATINVNELGAKAIVRPNGTPVRAGDLKAGVIVELIYDGTSFQLASVMPVGGSGSQVYTAAGSIGWTVPAGIYRVKATVVGGGGGGGGTGTGSTGGGGGGGGGCAIKWCDVTPGQVITVTVGAGGTGTSSIGNAGATSSFGSHCSATGGAGGSAYAALPAGGGAGVGVGGDININGSVGGDGGSNTAMSGNGGPGAGIAGGAGRGGTTSGVGGLFAGGGGGGGYLLGAGVATGGNGAPGAVILEW